MNCFDEQNADLLIGYFENTLPEAESLAVDAHASECAACRQMLGLHRTLDAYAAPEVSLNFDQRLYARIAADQVKPLLGFLKGWHVSNWKLAIPVTAVAAMLLIGVFVTREPAPVVDEGTKSADLEIRQLEQALDDLELLMPL